MNWSVSFAVDFVPVVLFMAWRTPVDHHQRVSLQIDSLAKGVAKTTYTKYQIISILKL